MSAGQDHTEGLAAEQALITVPARVGAVGWLNASLAASQDIERPLLYRTLSLEFFPQGVQLVGCDGTALLRSWVPSFDGADWPETEDAPRSSVIITDSDRFGAGFMRTVVRVTNDEAHAGEQLTVSTIAADEDAAPSLGAEFRRQRLVLRACGQRLDLQLMEARYPDWRALDLGISPTERVRELRVAPRLLGMLGRLKAVTALDLQFHGAERYIGFEGRGLVAIRGVIMPMRRPDEQAKTPTAKNVAAAAAVVEAVANLAPEPGSGIDSVTISAGGQSATLHQGDGDRIRRNLGVLRAKKKTTPPNKGSRS